LAGSNPNLSKLLEEDVVDVVDDQTRRREGLALIEELKDFIWENY